MKCFSNLRKISTLPLLFFLLDESYAGYWYGRNHHQTNKECPRGTRCLLSNRCRQSILRSLRESPRSCGYISYGKGRICCPEKRHFGGPPLGEPRIKSKPLRPITPKDCGKVNELQIVKTGVNPAKPGAWPWMVEIAKRNYYGNFIHICAGSMITTRHVLSAAHCFIRRKPYLYVARIGHVNRYLGQEYKILQINVPNSFKHHRYYHDIAVLTLSRNVISKDFSPICLPPSPEYVNLTGNSTTTSVGWGSTKPRSPPSTILMELPGIPTISNQLCSAIFRRKMRNYGRHFPQGITDGLICAGFLKDKKGKCWGQSGEPMMYQQGGRWYAVGVLSFGVVHLDCHHPGIPTGYTSVSKYLNWILQNISS